MPRPRLDFASIESIKQWSIELANACGGSQILFGKVKAPNAIKANALLDEFALAYDTQLARGGNDAGEEE